MNARARAAGGMSPRRPRCRAGIVGRLLMAALAWVAMVPGTAWAQLPAWLGQTAVEVRAGASIGSHSASAAALDIVPKPSFDLVVKAEVIPTLSAFGGYYRTAFGCDDGFCIKRDVTVVGNHVAVGAEWVPDIPQLLFQPWLRAGFLFGTTEAGTEGEAPSAGIGADAGVGLEVALGRVHVLPGVSYRYLTANTESSTAEAVALSFHVGLAIGLGGVP